MRPSSTCTHLPVSASHIRTFILDIGSFQGGINWTATKGFVVHLAEGVRGDPTGAFATPWGNRPSYSSVKARFRMNWGPIYYRGQAVIAFGTRLFVAKPLHPSFLDDAGLRANWNALALTDPPACDARPGAKRSSAQEVSSVTRAADIYVGLMLQRLIDSEARRDA